MKKKEESRLGECLNRYIFVTHRRTTTQLLIFTLFFLYFCCVKGNGFCYDDTHSIEYCYSLLESHFIITIIILQKYYNALSENGIRYKS